MNQIVCNYAAVRFLPYRETGEFVNVGVVAYFPELDQFDFRLDRRRTSRVTNFFPELDSVILREALRGMHAEFHRRRKQSFKLVDVEGIPDEIAKKGNSEFKQLLIPREGLLYCAQPGTLLADDVAQAMDLLYERFVNRQFAHSKKYQETEMRDQLDEFLREWNVRQNFQLNKPIGNADFRVKMPFVRFDEKEKAIQTLKPLDLDRERSDDVYEHGGAWVQRMDRLRSLDAMPDQVIFTVNAPLSGRPAKAAKTIVKELEQRGVEVVPFNNVKAIKKMVGDEVA